MHIAPSNVLAAAVLPNASEAVRRDDAARPFSFTIEGDVTVANYDASAGMIETNEGKTFAIGKTAGESSATQWQDYFGNVHYRCDQAGNCTLFRASIVVPNVKLAV
jgi:hypothetical protein